MPICKSIINFLTFQKPIQLTIPRGLWPHKFLSDILIWRGPNLEKCTCEIIVQCRIKIWGLRSAQIKKLTQTNPHSFWKIIGVCLLQLFDPSHCLVSNWDWSTCNWFTCKIFKKMEIFIGSALTPNRSKSPNIIYRWKAYTISEKNYILESWIRS